MVSRAPTPLKAAVAKLRKFYGPPAAVFPTDPFQQVLWENVAYLADDAHRRAAFIRLKQDVGLAPEDILGATKAQLRAVTSHGILPDTFVDKLRTAARILIGDFDGTLAAVVRRPLAEAKRALRKFPGIGEPGAEKILLFSGRQPLLAPDSNALRVVQRLGVAPALKSYSASYAAAREISAIQLGRGIRTLQAAHQLLRRHGREICKASRPACVRCPLAPSCAFVKAARA